jgi:hypothetical protein
VIRYLPSVEEVSETHLADLERSTDGIETHFSLLLSHPNLILSSPLLDEKTHRYGKKTIFVYIYLVVSLFDRATRREKNKRISDPTGKEN